MIVMGSVETSDNNEDGNILFVWHVEKLWVKKKIFLVTTICRALHNLPEHHQPLRVNSPGSIP